MNFGALANSLTPTSEEPNAKLAMLQTPLHAEDVSSLAARAPGWTLVGPALMTFLLTRVSGVAMLEAGMRARPGWDAYAARTSAFLPWPPRSREDERS